MVLQFHTLLNSVLKEIELQSYHPFVIHPLEELKTFENACVIVDLQGKAKWQIIDMLNEKYGTSFCLSHWLEGHADEVASFLNEAGSNALSHSEFKAPFRFHLWVGSKGFVIGIEQKGKGFNAYEVDQQKRRENQGAAFDFFRNCKSTVFFDDKEDARTVYLKVIV